MRNLHDNRFFKCSQGKPAGALLDNGADPEERFQGWTPLMKASEEGFVEIMKMLIEMNVDVEAVNRNGRTALSFAAAPSMRLSERRDTPIDALQLLLSKGADPTRKCTTRKWTPKQYAEKEKRHDAVTVLTEK